MSDQQPTQQRTSKARERQQRRKARQSATTQRPTAERKHLSPADAVGKLPNIDPRILKSIVFVGGAVIFMAVLIVGVGLFKNDPPQIAPNALWIGETWTYTDTTAETLQPLLTRLEEQQIGTVYARVSELNFDGTWIGRADGNAQFADVQDSVTNFATQFKEAAPDVRLYGTVYFRVDIGEEDGYRLDNDTIQRLVADFSSRVVNVLGYDGVLLVVEPVWNDNSDDFLDLLRMVRSTIGSDALLAIAAPPDWTPAETDIPQTDLIAPGTEWEREFKQRIALVGVDQIVVQAYNSYLTTPGDYRAWIAYQTATYAEAIGDLGTDTSVMIGVPTYASIPPAHDERIENVGIAVEGIINGLEAAGEFSTTIEGIAIYAEWETDETEWERLHTMWVLR